MINCRNCPEKIENIKTIAFDFIFEHADTRGDFYIYVCEECYKKILKKLKITKEEIQDKSRGNSLYEIINRL